MIDPHRLHVDLPAWAIARENEGRVYASDHDRMRLAIELSAENVRAGTGGPFGAAVFEDGSGRIVSIGVNSVVRLANSVLHAEMVAFMRAQARLGTYSLSAPGLPPHALYTSCDPCAMCLGAALWAGVKKIVCGATRQDAVSLRFDEGPVFPESYEYLLNRGIEIQHGMLRGEARAVLEKYRASGGVIYNAREFESWAPFCWRFWEPPSRATSRSRQKTSWATSTRQHYDRSCRSWATPRRMPTSHRSAGESRVWPTAHRAIGTSTSLTTRP